MNVNQCDTYDDINNELKHVIKTNNINLSVVLLCFNKLDYTRHCIDSVLKNTINDNYELIVVNNGSTDGTFEYLNEIKNKHDIINIIHNESNLGFSKGMNIGAKNANGKYLILLNNDTVVGEGWDYNLTYLLENNLIFAVTPSTNFSRSESNYEIEHSNYTDYFCKYNKIKYKFTPYFFASSLDLFCCCFKTKDFIEIGVLDEMYLNGCEDDDLYEKITNINKVVCISTQSVVYHFRNMTLEDENFNGLNNSNKINIHLLDC